MRLIDERDVVARLETVYGLRGAVKEEALCAVDMCKTVEAIPVEWLKKLQKESSLWDFTASASGDIIRRWEKEQGIGIDNSGKSGAWEPLGHISRGFAHPCSEYFKCSLCGYEAYTVFDPLPERCPECGAQMEQEAKA